MSCEQHLENTEIRCLSLRWTCLVGVEEVEASGHIQQQSRSLSIPSKPGNLYEQCWLTVVVCLPDGAATSDAVITQLLLLTL